ncbi:c-type cytochrome biogenesis protein CcmI [Candidatus Endowatersipora endosymbiont of Watersipora subatra]|uniref:c-type cytochrome biogenesis protein CcmI n=1 Tax=Candidatus Endowatersipora endosymbiont of Watersipora subatra TaxID=3077946 RepID=UPI00312C82E4
MVFWLIILLILLGATFLILLPMSHDSEVFFSSKERIEFRRMQLREINNRIETKNNSLSTDVLMAERTEIARRLIEEVAFESKNNPLQPSPRWPVYCGSSLVLIMIPTVSLILYTIVGDPLRSDVPLSSQKKIATSTSKIEILVATIEDILKKNPNDARGWNVLANYYEMNNYPSEARRALRNLIRLKGRSGYLLSRLGAQLTLINHGIVSDKAKTLFKEALSWNINDVVAQSHLAFALEQEGKLNESLEIWMKVDTIIPESIKSSKFIDLQIERLSSLLRTSFE